MALAVVVHNNLTMNGEEEFEEEMESRTVLIRNFAFNPDTLDIIVGETVSWVNEDDKIHTVTSFPAGQVFDSGPLEEGKIFTHTFSTPGEYPYHCSIHPTMAGKIIVK